MARGAGTLLNLSSHNNFFWCLNCKNKIITINIPTSEDHNARNSGETW